MIKVLMLGWEFPPQISGGLGVACHGLTSALLQYDDIHVTFVIPRAGSRDAKSRLNIVGADSVAISNRRRSDYSTQDTPSPDQDPAHRLVVEYVTADIRPYETPAPQNRSTHTRVRDANHNSIGNNADSEPPIDGTTTYRFEGGYGRQLLVEVDPLRASCGEPCGEWRLRHCACTRLDDVSRSSGH